MQKFNFWNIQFLIFNFILLIFFSIYRIQLSRLLEEPFFQQIILFCTCSTMLSIAQILSAKSLKSGTERKPLIWEKFWFEYWCVSLRKTSCGKNWASIWVELQFGVGVMGHSESFARSCAPSLMKCGEGFDPFDTLMSSPLLNSFRKLGVERS
jgi:hypothetical protein